MAEAGATVEMLGAEKATANLLGVVSALAQRNEALLARSRPFAGQIADKRLALEVSAIQTFAEDLNRRLRVRDPLSERVHHRKLELMPLALSAFLRFLGRRRPA